MDSAHIEVRNVSRRFETSTGPIIALSETSLAIKKGEIVSLVGPSGCGKSTLLSLLSGLSHPSAGDVAINGEAPHPCREVGLMFQHSLLFAWRTVLENVMLGAELFRLPKDESRDRALELLRMIGLAGWEDRQPRELSGGMRQRVALARVLLPDPSTLLLDEPFGALDEMTREELDLELCRVAALTDKTVVLVTHGVHEAVLVSDRVFVLSDRPGRVVGEVDVPLPRPRDIEMTTSVEFASVVAEVRHLLYAGSGKAL